MISKKLSIIAIPAIGVALLICSMALRRQRRNA